MTNLYIRMQGQEIIRTRINRMKNAMVHSQPAMELVATELLRIEDQTFASQGRRGGGSWRKVTEEWFLRKATSGLDLRTGHATRALREAMSNRGAEHQRLEVTPKKVNLGTDLPYAGTQQQHRPFVKLTPGDRIRIRNIIRDYLMEAGV